MFNSKPRSQLSLDYLCSGVVRGGERKGEERRKWRMFYKGTLIPVSPMHSTHLLNFLYPLIPRSSPHLLSGGLESHRHIYWGGRCQSFISCCCEVSIWQEPFQGRKGLFHLRVQVPEHWSGEANVAPTGKRRDSSIHTCQGSAYHLSPLLQSRTPTQAMALPALRLGFWHLPGQSRAPPRSRHASDTADTGQPLLSSPHSCYPARRF